MLTDTSSSSKIYSYPVGRNITGHSFTIEVLQVRVTPAKEQPCLKYLSMTRIPANGQRRTFMIM